jgi:hypothetical protein
MMNQDSDPVDFDASVSLAEQLSDIRDAIDSLAGFSELAAQLKASCEAVEALTDEVGRLTTSIEGLVMEIRNRDGPPLDELVPRRMHVASMPLDPLAPDWRINRTCAGDLPDQQAVHSPTAQQVLFD